jgi:uncharacterized protein DUF5832
MEEGSKRREKKVRASQKVTEEENLKGGRRVGASRDPITVPDQQFAVISIVAPEGTRQRSKKTAIKIRGVFPDEVAARKHCEELFKHDPDFDLQIVQMYEWLVIPPPLEHQNSIPMEYQQEKLNDIMKGYYEQIKRGKKEVETRMKTAQKEAKRRLKEKGIKSNLEKEKRTAQVGPPAQLPQVPPPPPDSSTLPLNM